MNTTPIRGTLAVLLTANVLDFFFTRTAFSMGATEANPVMAYLFNVNPWLPLLAKILLVTLLGVLVWNYRTKPWVNTLIYGTCLVYVGVIAYHVGCLTTIGVM
jgi:hypothetical protein